MTMRDDIPLIQQLDQFGASAENIAGIVANYHEKLRREHVPPDLVNLLTLNFQDLLWKSIFMKGKEPNDGETPR